MLPRAGALRRTLRTIQHASPGAAQQSLYFVSTRTCASIRQGGLALKPFLHSRALVAVRFYIAKIATMQVDNEAKNRL